MSFLGETNEKIVGVNAILKLGDDTFRLKSRYRLHVGRPKDRQATSAGPCITYGAGDSFLDATIIGSTPEIATLNALTVRGASGTLPSNTWNLVLTPKVGSPVNISFTGEMPEFDIVSDDNEKPIDFEIHIDITSDVVTVT